MQRPTGTDKKAAEKAALERERNDLLEHVDALLDKPLIVLGLVWLVLLVIDLTHGLQTPMIVLTYVIWGLFVLDFLLELVISPSKKAYLRRHWLTALALALPPLRLLRAVPALRVLRALRAVRAARSISLVRVLTSVNRAMGTIRAVLGRRGIGYVTGLTAVVAFAGAAGMYSFESPASLRASGYADIAAPGVGLRSYAEALWWTSMTLTTMGSDYFPKTGEGRILGWLLAVYAFAIFGYITATIASFFLGEKGRG